MPKRVHEKDVLIIRRHPIKTKVCYLTDEEKERIVRDTEEVIRLTDEDVTDDGKIVKKEKKK
jgi:hypothetical protein